MPDLSAANSEQVLQACRSKLEAISQSLNRCFDTKCRLEAGDMQPLAGAAPLADLTGPGVVVAFCVGQTSMLCAISAALPLPAWYTDPNPVQIARLETLAREWSRNCLPDELPGENFASFTVASLNDCLASAQPLQGAVRLPLLRAAVGGDAVDLEERIWLVWPAHHLPIPPDSNAGHETPGAMAPAHPPSPPASRRSSPAPLSGGPLDRLRDLPVPVIVKLAEKKVELGQVLAIGPGAIITFEKSCEDLLDLYVNNQLFCRGEAVKIGEKFGIKICEVGSAEERVSAVLAME